MSTHGEENFTKIKKHFRFIFRMKSNCSEVLQARTSDDSTTPRYQKLCLNPSGVGDTASQSLGVQVKRGISLCKPTLGNVGLQMEIQLFTCTPRL